MCGEEAYRDHEDADRDREQVRRQRQQRACCDNHQRHRQRRFAPPAIGDMARDRRHTDAKDVGEEDEAGDDDTATIRALGASLWAGYFYLLILGTPCLDGWPSGLRQRS